MSSFLCFYCGNFKPTDETSDEHIIASCIGGNRNVTLTDQVCKTCNQFAGDEIDRPFCRDWIIESMRLIAGVSHRGKRPAVFMGQLRWGRPERVGMYLLQGGAQIAVIECADGARALALIANPDDLEMMKTVKNVVDAKFPGLRIINSGSPRRPYDDELVEAFAAVGASIQVRFTIDTLAWHRAIVKMALGLACQTFGEEFVTSESAQRLRAFMNEPDRDRWDDLGLLGRGGSLASEPTITPPMHPGGDQHLFALLATDGKVGFAANLFGRFENVLLVDSSGAFVDRLPGMKDDVAKGIAWIVEPATKITTGPTPVLQLLAEALH